MGVPHFRWGRGQGGLQEAKGTSRPARPPDPAGVRHGPLAGTRPPSPRHVLGPGEQPGPRGWGRWTVRERGALSLFWVRPTESCLTPAPTQAPRLDREGPPSWALQHQRRARPPRGLTGPPGSLASGTRVEGAACIRALLGRGRGRPASAAHARARGVGAAAGTEGVGPARLGLRLQTCGSECRRPPSAGPWTAHSVAAGREGGRS